MSAIIPQSLDQQEAVQTLGHTIGAELHSRGVTVADKDFEVIAAAIAVQVGTPTEVAVFVAIDAAIWSTHILDSIEVEVQTI